VVLNWGKHPHQGTNPYAPYSMESKGKLLKGDVVEKRLRTTVLATHGSTCAALLIVIVVGLLYNTMVFTKTS